jgi:hypothetical protein
MPKKKIITNCNKNLTIDTKKSAGQGTVILFSIPNDNLENLEKIQIIQYIL